MSRIEISNAIAKVADKIKRGEIATIEDATIESIVDLDYYVEQAVWAKLRADNNAVVRSIQEAQMTSTETAQQITIPGLENGALPRAVKDLSAPEGQLRMKPLRAASVKEIKSEIRSYRRRVDTRSRVVAAYEATWEHVERLVDIDDTTTGEDIENQLRAITA